MRTTTTWLGRMRVRFARWLRHLRRQATGRQTGGQILQCQTRLAVATIRGSATRQHSTQRQSGKLLNQGAWPEHGRHNNR